MPTALFPVASRRPRFRRVEALPAFQLTPRDFVIVGIVARFRFLTSEQIARFVGGSYQQIQRRLQLLFHHGYLDRPHSQKVQFAHVLDDGNRPFVYGLGRRGAQLLAEAGAPINDKLDWTQKNQRATAQFLAHTVETAETMMAFEFACRGDNLTSLVDQHGLLPFLPEDTRSDTDPFRCRVTLRLKELSQPLTIAVIPDRLFSLNFADNTRKCFALELDRGTMDIKSRRLIGKSSFRRKLLGYWQLWQSDGHTQRWGFKSFRVLTVTPSEKRLRNMIAAQKEIVGAAGSNLFLFTTPERLTAQNPLGKVWLSGKGDEVSLVA